MKYLRLTVLAGIALLVGVLVLVWTYGRLAPAHERAIPPTIVVEATYPGANANVLADTVATPIEQEINGLEGLQRLRSYCGNDGTFSLVVSFAPGTDLNVAQVLIQNRASLALPKLPASVQQSGVRVLKKSPIVRALLALTSPEGRYDEIYLSNYATIQLRDELTRIPGVGDVELFGRRNFGIQVWLDGDRLAARALTANDVVKALQEQNLQPAAEPVAKGLSVTVNPTGRLAAPEELENLVVKVGPHGEKILLRDVARVELGVSGESHSAGFNGKPAVGLAVHPLSPKEDAKTLLANVRKAAEELRGKLPDGLALEFAFEFTPAVRPDVLLLDVELPAGASAERTQKVLEHCDTVTRTIPGVTKTLISLDDPFSASRHRPCILVGIEPEKLRGGREALLVDLHVRLGKEVHEAVVRVNDLAAPGRTTPGGYPVSFAVCDVSDSGHEALAKVAEQIVQRLHESGQLTDVGTSPPLAATPELFIEIDRRLAADVGVKIADIETAVQTALGGFAVGSSTQFGRTWQIVVRTEPGRQGAEALVELQVPAANGKLVPLRTLAAVRHETVPQAVERFDLSPMIEISGNPAPGVTLAEARAACEKIAAKELGAGFKIEWLSAPK
ncbi:MAG TPA: efflux RND transporter permease subunit [Gemmataceae bacterium]|nr:efflux RND transporter permease subunit [Gemmataceae bacterium]